jgi:hypothetical protein
MSRWEGKFSSTVYPAALVSGDISVNNVDPSKDNYETTATVTYRGVYHLNQSSSVKVFVSGDTMTVSIDSREITFTIATKTDKMINGTYTCKRPYDSGQFYLQPEGSPPIENAQSCSIM